MEKFAVQVIFSDSTISVFGVAVICAFIGFLVSMYMRRSSKWSMPRAPYFLYLSVLSLAASFTSFISILMPRAIEIGVVWGVLFFIMLCSLIYGYFYGVVSHARSINAYGSGKFAFLGCVPFGNLFLLFQVPENTADSHSFRFNALLLVVLGLVIFAAARFIDTKGDEVSQSILKSLTDEHDKIISSILIDEVPLEKLLKGIADTSFPKQIDDITHLDKVEASSNVIKYIYSINYHERNLPPHFRDALLRGVCSNLDVRKLLERGAVYQYFYKNKSGVVVGDYSFQVSECN